MSHTHILTHTYIHGIRIHHRCYTCASRSSWSLLLRFCTPIPIPIPIPCSRSCPVRRFSLRFRFLWAALRRIYITHWIPLVVYSSCRPPSGSSSLLFLFPLSASSLSPPISFRPRYAACVVYRNLDHRPVEVAAPHEGCTCARVRPSGRPGSAQSLQTTRARLRGSSESHTHTHIYAASIVTFPEEGSVVHSTPLAIDRSTELGVLLLVRRRSNFLLFFSSLAR
ncbi:hypothetical protein C8Q80DRAFT_1209019 [Daedaleopsis nitida]|nr:hypothetical protein C8Q80DRAFT_1209019 [Daedaleopsis nitida]